MQYKERSNYYVQTNATRKVWVEKVRTRQTTCEYLYVEIFLFFYCFMQVLYTIHQSMLLFFFFVYIYHTITVTVCICFEFLHQIYLFAWCFHRNLSIDRNVYHWIRIELQNDNRFRVTNLWKYLTMSWIFFSYKFRNNDA